MSCARRGTPAACNVGALAPTYGTSQTCRATDSGTRNMVLSVYNTSKAVRRGVSKHVLDGALLFHLVTIHFVVFLAATLIVAASAIFVFAIGARSFALTLATWIIVLFFLILLVL
jgi:hypothetical protein